MFASPKITEVGNNVYASYGDDNGLYPVFSVEAVKDEEASIKEGRDIYKDVEWITIHIVGDKLTAHSRPVQPNDKQRFQKHYEAFKNQNIQLNTGTPLTEWSLIGKAMAMNLKAMNIHTVEQLASVADGNLTWMGARDLQKKAIAWLDSAKENAGISKLSSENEALRRDLEAIKNQMAAMMSEPKKRGRPAKGDQDEQDTP